ncbi:hypothetical protein BT69DRAFT_7416 [Atractiella rhizophila]|nr:hypothetical protein BT69DRAFT_7416 [Atractiella rhizophila]
MQPQRMLQGSPFPPLCLRFHRIWTERRRTAYCRSAFMLSVSEMSKVLTRKQTIASALLTQPTPPHRPIYYTSLLAQLCLSAPATVAPALGKRIRYLYSILGTAGNAGVVVRLADWLSTHLSNFNFLWVWGEWCIPSSLL